MKICYQHTRPVEDPKNDAFFNRLKKNFKKICREDSQVDIKYPKVGAKEFKYIVDGHPYCSFLREVEMVEGLRQAQEEGYDAGIIGCFGDPGLNVLRAMLDIPIIGVKEASLMIGQMYGITGLAVLPLPGTPKGPIFSIQQSGAMSFKTITRTYALSSEEISKDMVDDPSRLTDEFIRVGKQLINGGAKSLCATCTGFTSIVTSMGITEISDVPVIDCTIAAVKVAEILIDLKKVGLWKSHRTISAEILNKLRKVYYSGGISYLVV